VNISAQQTGDTVSLRVANSDRTLASEDVPKIFEPFWRKDAARSDGKHSGLGLSLVAEYARILGLRVTADLPENGVFQIRIEAPAVPQAPAPVAEPAMV
jgi:two-component system sensor histidine kinase QseC